MEKKFYQQQEELKHFGVLGMKWGQRRAVKQVGRKSGGKRFIVDKDQFGQTMSQRKVTKKEFDSFMDAQKKQKAEELFRKQKKWHNVGKAVTAFLAVHTAVSIVGMMHPNLYRNAVGSLAWTFGRVVSNSPLR